MYQLLGPLSTSKENVLTSRCHVSQLFSQWAISTGEKSPKNYWGIFFYFHLKFWKVLIEPQLSIKEFLQNQSVKKKKFSPSLKVTQGGMMIDKPRAESSHWFLDLLLIQYSLMSINITANSVTAKLSRK